MKNEQLLYHAFILLLLSFTAIPLLGQEKEQLSLDQALIMAAEHNASIKIQTAEFWEMRAKARQSLATFLPQVEVSSLITQTNDPLNVFGQKLKQGVVTQMDFIPEDLNNPKAFDNYNMRIDIRQPLFNLNGIIGRSAAKDAKEAKKWELERVKSYINFEVKKQYFALSLAIQKVKVLEQALLTANENSELVKHLYEQDYVKEVDRLAVNIYEVELQNKLDRAKNDIITANEYFAMLLGTEITTEFDLTDKLDNNYSEITANDKLSENRADIKAYELGLNARKKMYHSAIYNFVPQLNAFGTLEWNSAKFMKNNKRNYIVGLQFSWKLFSGYQSIGKAQETKASWMKSAYEFENYKDKNQLELRKANRQIHLLSNELKRAKLVEVQAKESLRIRTNRYKEGLEKTTDLLQNQTLYAEKQLKTLYAHYSYQVQSFYLEFLH